MTERRKYWTETLGDTPDEIAANLLAMGVRGIPKDSCNCILVRAYRHICPNGWSGIRVNYSIYKDKDGGEWVSGNITFNDLQIVDPPCPKPVAEFMYKFDKGEYPFLINKPIPSKESVLATLTVEQRITLRY